MFALQEDINSNIVESRHFDQALTLIKPRIGPELIKYYENYKTQKD